MTVIERFLPQREESRSRKAGPTSIPRSSPSRGEGSRRISGRRWLGLLLVAISLAGGYLTITRADQRIAVVAMRGDLTSGQVIEQSDVELIQAALPVGLYATDVGEVVGQSVLNDMHRGEVLPISSLAKPSRVSWIALPVRTINLPPLTRGNRVDLWSGGVLLASDLAIASLTKEATTMVVTVEVPPELVPTVVPALAQDLVVVKSL